MGALRRVEADRRRRTSRGVVVAGDRDPRACATATGCSTWSRTSRCSRSVPGGLIKMAGQEPPVLGVNNAIELAARTIEGERRAGSACSGTRRGRARAFDGVLRAEGAAEGAGQLDLRDRHRPRGAGRPDLQELRRRRARSPRRRACTPTSGRAPAAAAATATTATSSR